MGTCAKERDLRVLNQSNGQDLLPDPAALIARFAREYKEDAEMQSVDAVVCSHPAAMCEVFEPLNKSLLVYATTRYEMGRCFSDAQQQGCSLDPSRWRSWSRKLFKVSPCMLKGDAASWYREGKILRPGGCSLY